MSAPAPLLAARDVSKRFGGRLALDHVTLTVDRGEMIALIGASGSGKSTLLRALAALTLIDADGGVIEAFGETVQAHGRAGAGVRRIRARIGFIFQQFNLVGRLSLFTNVALGALGAVPFWRGLVGLWPRETRLAAMRALARVGIADRAAQRAGSLSGGQQQRGAIARALTQGAEVILADEPVASLDPVSARRVMQALADLNAVDGLTVLVTLHQVEFALRYCRRVVALAAGRIVYDGPVVGLDRATLADVYGPEFEDAVWLGGTT